MKARSSSSCNVRSFSYFCNGFISRIVVNLLLVPSVHHLHERRALYGEGDNDVAVSAREYEERSHKVQMRQRPTHTLSDAAGDQGMSAF